MRIFLAGHRGLAGRAIAARIAADWPDATLIVRPRDALDLADQAATRAFMLGTRPDAVILAAARVGGIAANSAHPARFLHENLAIADNVLAAAAEAGTDRVLVLGSSCIYPRATPQPIREEALLSGPLEPTNAAYALAKIAALELCAAWRAEAGSDFRALMPCNLYGPHDNFCPRSGHVLPALLARFHTAAEAGAPEIVVWGSGRPLREFLHVDDLARAVLLALGMDRARWEAATGPDRAYLNAGSGHEISIAGLAEAMARLTGFAGRIRFDSTRPDGTPRKLLDSGRLRALGWRPAVPLEGGLAAVHDWFVRHRAEARGLAAAAP